MVGVKIKMIKGFVGSLLILGLLGGIPRVSGSSSVPIRDIEYLTFHRGELTTGRRERPVPQLICTTKWGGKNEFESIVCKNMGWDGTDVVWQCEASLDEGFEIEKTHIICEGYNYPEDPHILAGSCSLSYSLHDTNQPSPQTKDTFLIFLTVVIWTIIIVFVCGANRRTGYFPTYHRTNDGPGFWTGAGLGYWAGSRSDRSSLDPSLNYKASRGGRHTIISYAKTGRR